MSMTLVVAGLVLTSCTAADPEPPTDDASGGPAAAASDAPTSAAEPNDDASDQGGETSDTDDDPPGTDGGTSDTDGGTAADPPPSDAGDPDDVASILEQIFAAEHVVRVELAERAASGDDLGDVEELTGLFLATRTPQAARAEAEAIARLGGDELAAFTADGVQEPEVGDVEVERARTGCVLLSTQLDVLPTYNDSGLIDVNIRIVGGNGNETEWLIDGLSTGDLPDC